ncbi:MAG: lysophospholipid acyltransferase family protein [Saprospiraceae bacterium]
MKPILYSLAGVRAFLIFGGMAMYLIIYSISCIFIKHTRERAFKLRKHYLRYICIPILNIKIEKQGDPQSFPCLYVSNHRSFTDPIVLCSFLDALVIAKAEVMNYPIINKGAELTGVIWVDRKDQSSRNDTRSKLVETIKSGYNILVYPEGTVGKDSSTLPFRKGTFLEAAENEIAVIPVAIEYKSKKDLWVIGKFLPQYFFQFSKWQTNVKLAFGNPVTGNDVNTIYDETFNWINMEIKKMQQDWSDAF